jgi:hypothetical protein
MQRLMLATVIAVPRATPKKITATRMKYCSRFIGP